MPVRSSPRQLGAGRAPPGDDLGPPVILTAMANPEHLGRLLDSVDAWNEWRASGPLGEVDLRGADLSGLDLRGADLWYARLQGGDLRATNLSEAVLVRADLTLADISHAALYRADLRGAILDRCVLRAAALVDADLTLAKVTRAELDGAILTDARLEGANFFGSPTDAAYGLGDDVRWIEEEAGIPKREFPSVDLRGQMFGGLRGTGAT